jgi:acyl-CoA dehydrogenase
VTDSQSLLRDSVRRILMRQNDRPAGSDSAGGLPKAWDDLADAGMIGVGLCQDLGGSGGTFADAATLVFESGRLASLLPVPETLMLANWLNAETSRRSSGGAETVAIGIDDELKITRRGDGCELNGVIAHVPWARLASRVIVSIEAGNEHVLLWLSPEDYAVAENENLAGEPRDSVIIRNAHVPSERFCHSPVSSQTILLRGALTRSIAMAGAMIAVLDLTLAHSSTREQFGQPLNKFQAVQQLLARLAGEVFAAVATTRDAVEAFQTDDGTFEALVACVRVSQAGLMVPRIAHQIHGALGVTDEYALHRFTNRIWSWRGEFGHEQLWSTAVTHFVRERDGLSSLWPLVTNPSLKTLEPS